MSMIYKPYGRSIPNLTRYDGSALERQFVTNTNKKGTQLATIMDTMAKITSLKTAYANDFIT